MKAIGLRTMAAAALIAALCACKNPNSPDGNSLAITHIAADGYHGSSTTKLTLTLSGDVPDLTADDIKINADFPVIKGILTKTEAAVYELAIIPGGSGHIRAGLDPHRGFTGWDAKTAEVHAVFHFSGTAQLTITGYNGPGGEIAIPVEIAGIPVAVIGTQTFANKLLTGVTIPDSVIVIGYGAFANNQLTGVTLPQYLSVLSGFNGNQLTNINIPGSVTSIGDYAFADNQLDDVTIPENVTTIGSDAFMNNHLASVVIPGRVTSIGNNVFRDNRLTSITIPDSVTAIGNSAFSGNRLAGVIIPETVTYIGVYAFVDNILTSIKIGANVVLNSSFGGGFEIAYNTTYDRAGGIYTRLNIGSTDWVKKDGE